MKHKPHKHILSQSELDELVELHQLWLMQDPRGRQFNVKHCIFKGLIIDHKILINSIWRHCIFVDLTLCNVCLNNSILDRIKFIELKQENVSFQSTQKVFSRKDRIIV